VPHSQPAIRTVEGGNEDTNQPTDRLFNMKQPVMMDLSKAGAPFSTSRQDGWGWERRCNQRRPQRL